MRTKPLIITYGISDGYDGMIDDNTPRHEAYCHEWDMNLEQWKHEFMHGGGENKGWDKLHLLLRTMEEFPNQEYIAYLDADTAIIDFDQDILGPMYCSKSAWLGLTVHPYINYLGDSFHWNVGAMYLRNCTDSRAFLRECIEDGDVPGAERFNEQGRINHKLLYEPAWQAGLLTLPSRYNNNIHDMPHENAIVAAWHGVGTGPERRQIMAEWLNGHPYA